MGDLVTLTRNSLRDPALAVRQLQSLNLPMQARWMALAVVVALSAILGTLAMQIFPQPAEGGLDIPVLSPLVLAVLRAGVIVLTAWGRHDHDDVNTAGARLHVIGDLLGSVGAVGAALLIRWMDWLWADPAISIVVSLLILNSAWRLLARCAHILLEGTPDGVEVEEIATTLRDSVAGVSDVHHVHAWQLAGGSRIATLHVRLDGTVLPDPTIVAIQTILRDQFAIGHSTVQIEGFDSIAADCADCG